MFSQGFFYNQKNRCDVFKYHEKWESQEETQGAAALRNEWDEIVDQVLLLFLNLIIGKQDFISLKEFCVMEYKTKKPNNLIPNRSCLKSNVSPTSVNFLYEHGGLHPVMLVISVLVLSRRLLCRWKYLLKDVLLDRLSPFSNMFLGLPSLCCCCALLHAVRNSVPWNLASYFLNSTFL